MAKTKSQQPCRDKLEKPQQIKIEYIDDPSCTWGTGNMLIATPMIVDSYIRKIPKGKLMTVAALRKKMAQDHQADFSCPLTTGIFARISAEAAEEDKAAGKTDITPYWRLVKEDGKLNDKFPGGMEQQAAYLREEGFQVVKKTARSVPAVLHYEEYLL